MARLWAPSWKCWASALDSQQKLPLSRHCPEAFIKTKKGLPFPESYQNGTKICSPNPSQGGRGFPQLLAHTSFVAIQNFTWFSECSKTSQMGPQPPKHLKNRAQSASKSLPKTILESILEKTGPTLSSTHYLLYIQQVGHLQTPTVFHASGYLKCDKNWWKT